jgi:hypothetical protein
VGAWLRALHGGKESVVVVGGIRSTDRAHGRWGWVAVGTMWQCARGQGAKGPVGVAAVGPAQSPQCHFAINQGFLGQMKLQTIKSWSYVAQKFQIKYEIIGN